MRYIGLSLAVLTFFSCKSTPKVNTSVPEFKPPSVLTKAQDESKPLPSIFDKPEVYVSDKYAKLATETLVAVKDFQAEPKDKPKDKTEEELTALANNVSDLPAKDLGAIYESPVSYEISKAVVNQNLQEKEKSPAQLVLIIGGASLIAVSLMTAVVLTSNRLTTNLPKDQSIRDIYKFQIEKSLLLKNPNYLIQDIYNFDEKLQKHVKVGTEFVPKDPRLPKLYALGTPVFYKEGDKMLDALQHIENEPRNIKIPYDQATVKSWTSFEANQSSKPLIAYDFELGGKKYHSYYKENVGYILEEGEFQSSKAKIDATKLKEGLEVKGYREQTTSYQAARQANFEELGIKNPSLTKSRVVMAEHYKGMMAGLSGGIIVGLAGVLGGSLSLAANKKTPYETLLEKFVDIEKKLTAYHKAD